MSIENFSVKHPAAIEEMEQNLGNPELIKPVVDLEKLAEEVADNDVLKKMVEKTIEYCERYTESVAAYQELLINPSKDKADIKELDQTQRLIHNATIDQINILFKALTKFGKDASWIKNFRSRADYGKLALLTTYKSLMRMRKEFQNEEKREND